MPQHVVDEAVDAMSMWKASGDDMAHLGWKTGRFSREQGGRAWCDLEDKVLVANCADTVETTPMRRVHETLKRHLLVFEQVIT